MIKKYLLLLFIVFSHFFCLIAEEGAVEKSFAQKIDAFVGEAINGPMCQLLGFGPNSLNFGGFPFIIIVLLFGGIFFTLRLGFINIKLFKHGIDCVRGKYDNPDDDGEISHFKALTSALSATVGLGNIGGVAIAIATGGPGAILWMWIVAFFGMSMKYTSCTIAQVYRRISPEGKVLGGPMVYLEDGIKDRFPKLLVLGKVFGVVAAVFTVMASFGGGNLFQGKVTYAIATTVTKTEAGDVTTGAWIFGIVLAALVGMVIIGGIKRIGSVTSKLVPLMCLCYSLICIFIIVFNIEKVPAMFSSIFTQAFSENAMYGGFLGVLIKGVMRAAFSNEAGLGSASIAHAAAKTKEPVREGVVAMLGPFIDTIIVCTMTALAILITDMHVLINDMNLPEGGSAFKGAVLTAHAFGSVHESLQIFLVVAAFIFAYSTMISWSYYGERATEYLFGTAGIVPYRVVYTVLVAIGPVMSMGNVLDFADFMLLSMAIPNIIGLVFLSPVLVEKTKSYISRLNSGEMKPVE